MTQTHYEQLALPAEQHLGELMAWAPVKPVAPGAYWVRGNGLSRPALIEVAHEYGQLRCNLHDRTTCDNFGIGYSVEQLSDEFEFCGPLYTHADPGEVQRLRGLVGLAESEALSAIVERDELREQLAERDALLRDCFTAMLKGGYSKPLRERIKAVLSASAEPSAPKCGHTACKSLGEPHPFCDFVQSLEPSAPVERDERAAFEAAWSKLHKHEGKSPFMRIEPLGNYRWGDVHEGWIMWQARAALERAEHHG